MDDLDPLLIDALIAVESNGDPSAVSSQGAKGLCQLMDATGEEWHGLLKIRDPYDPFNAAQNRLIGAAYLEYLMKSFGDWRLALAAYNAGPGRLRRAIESAGSDEWIKVRDWLPEETRLYVPKVFIAYKERCDAVSV